MQAGATKFVDDNLDFLLGEIKKNDIKSPLDVENAAPVAEDLALHLILLELHK
jgi:hypothetical protein